MNFDNQVQNVAAEQCTQKKETAAQRRARLREELEMEERREVERERFIDQARVGFNMLRLPVEGSIGQLQATISQFMDMQGFWVSESTPEKIALMHSELSEALEAYRNGAPPDDKVPQFDGVTAELADTVIRILDFAGHFQLPLGKAIIEKMLVNLERPYKHGKTC